MGAFGAGAVVLTPLLPESTSAWVFIPVMALAGIISGGIWGFIPGFLKARLRVNEIITTLMMNYIGILLLEYLVYGAWKDPTSFGFPMTPVFSEQAIVGKIEIGR